MDEVPESEQKLESKQAEICVSYQPTARGMMSRMRVSVWRRFIGRSFIVSQKDGAPQIAFIALHHFFFFVVVFVYTQNKNGNYESLSHNSNFFL